MTAHHDRTPHSTHQTTDAGAEHTLPAAPGRHDGPTSLESGPVVRAATHAHTAGVARVSGAGAGIAAHAGCAVQLEGEGECPVSGFLAAELVAVGVDFGGRVIGEGGCDFFDLYLTDRTQFIVSGTDTDGGEASVYHPAAKHAYWSASHEGEPVYDSAGRGLTFQQDTSYVARAVALYTAEYERGTDTDSHDGSVAQVLVRALATVGIASRAGGTAAATYVKVLLPDGSAIWIDDAVHESANHPVTAHRRLQAWLYPCPETEGGVWEKLSIAPTGSFWGDTAALLITVLARYQQAGQAR